MGINLSSISQQKGIFEPNTLTHGHHCFIIQSDLNYTDWLQCGFECDFFRCLRPVKNETLEMALLLTTQNSKTWQKYLLAL